jgi:hypothetical protein
MRRIGLAETGLERIVDGIEDLDGARIGQQRVRMPRLRRAIPQGPKKCLGHTLERDLLALDHDAMVRRTLSACSPRLRLCHHI